MPSERTISIECTDRASCAPERVMDVLLDATSWPSWNPEIASMHGPRRLGPGDKAAGIARMLGFEVEGRTEAVEVGDAAFEEDVVVGVRMRIRYEVVPSSGGAVVRARMDARLPGGPAGVVLSFFLRRRLARMQKHALANLVERCMRSAGSAL